jgi:GDP/UDP-N,N'-diacetylbacillosamine 2-epimerase (hydrolysing)
MKVCFITGTRADYGLLKPLIDELLADKYFEVQIVITGMHLSPEFGLTYKEISLEGISEVEKVEILLSSDTSDGISKSMGLGMISFAEAFQRLKPDLIIGLGDRFELFSAVSAAMIARIPVAHLHGGEATEGLIDEAIRHSITKMSHLHFTSTEEYRRRVIQLGEDPSKVFNVGAIGLDNIENLKLLSKNEIEKELALSFGDKNLLVTFHPVTLENRSAEYQFGELLDALNYFEDIKTIFTMPNADTDGRIIINMIEDYVSTNHKRAKAFKSLGQLKYLSTIKFVDGVIGNSSSGIIEVPSFKKGTINIGERQRGRILVKSVICCNPNSKEIKNAIRLLYSSSFRKKISSVKNPYGDGSASKRIHKILKQAKLEGIINKKFYNLTFDL